MRDVNGGFLTVSRLKTRTGRIGFEKRYFPCLHISRFGWELTFTSDRQPIHAGSEGILFAPPELFRRYDRLGIEQVIHDLNRLKSIDIELWMCSAIYAVKGTQRVEMIVYRLEAIRDRRNFPIYETVMRIESKKINPGIHTEKKELMVRRDWMKFLR